MEHVAEPLREEVELVHAAQRGDRDAFGRLYDISVTSVYRYLRSRLAEPSDAEDLTADVFMKAMQALPSYRHQGVPFVAWLFRIAHNELANFRKRQTRRREVPLEDDLPSRGLSRDDPSEAALTRMAFSEVQEAMRELTPLQQQVVTLRFAGELSIAETAQAMRRSQGAVKFLQHSALRALQGKLQPKEIPGHGG